MGTREKEIGKNNGITGDNDFHYVNDDINDDIEIQMARILQQLLKDNFLKNGQIHITLKRTTKPKTHRD
jgi:hypothetical protein